MARLLLSACIFPVGVLAQTQVAPASGSGKPVAGPSSVTVLSAPRWMELTSAQQKSLSPLASHWETLSDGHKRKWIALVQGFSNRTPEEQAKLHSRMAEWATLKPKDREQARLNFAETKKITPQDRSANWEAYQALTPEERKELAAGAQTKPVGAAMAIKPVPPQKLAEFPLPRKNLEIKRPLVNHPDAINRSTLLPVSTEPIAPATQPN